MTHTQEYTSPDFEVVEVMVERGFENSLEDPWENDEIIW
jgi:hypothetical protein